MTNTKPKKNYMISEGGMMKKQMPKQKNTVAVKMTGVMMKNKGKKV